MSESDKPAGQYKVIFLRYRPTTFEEMIGQDHLVQALQNAIDMGRVGHAYLFTGARGTGKTSAARIFAKALNCVNGPTKTPCNECDACESIALGDDVNVLEIDGASNRGIDEIRDLRSNAIVRPSRSRLKIYIIDEVHMLTTPAFNALLKTLEEPPSHVKFIFCTTDPEKIPITVLSRCQRYDFAPIETSLITGRLEQIVAAEGLKADEEALQLLARRATGSMRDSQSLLEQLLSFCDDRITVQHVHEMLGTAQSGRLADLAQHLVRRDSAAALRSLDSAVQEGVDVGQLADQLVGFFRDLLAASVGADAELMLNSRPEDFEQLQAVGQELGSETLMAALQILDQTLSRMRFSVQIRTLLEVALVRICRLEDLDDISSLIAELRSQSGARAVSGSTAKSSGVRLPGKSPVAAAQKKK